MSTDCVETQLYDSPGVRKIAANSVSTLPWLPPPAGYVILIRDVAYGHRYKIARHQQLDQHLIKHGADFPFETRVSLILECENAAQAERELSDELAAGEPLGDWFDLPPPTPIQPSHEPQLDTVSLRDLALNDYDAESLLLGAQIVGASSPATDSTTPAKRAASIAARHSRWTMRRAFALLFIIFALVLATGQGAALRQALESLLDAALPQASSRRAPAQSTASGVTRSRSSSSAPSATRMTLTKPQIIVAEKTATYIRINWYKMPQAESYQYRYRVNGGAFTAWTTLKRFTAKLEGLSPGDMVTFRLRARRVGVYSPVAQITAWTLPAPTQTEVESQGEVFYLRHTAGARSCARLSCRVVAVLPQGAQVIALRYEIGELIADSDRWIRSIYEGRSLYVHSSVLSKEAPEAKTATALPSSTPQPTTATAEPSPTPQPQPETSSATELSPTAAISATDLPAPTLAPLVASPPRYVVETAGNLNANIRACPSTTCDIVENFPAGTELDVLASVTGERVYETDVWLEINLNNVNAYIHSELVAAAD